VFVSYSCPNIYGLDRATGGKIWHYSVGCSGGGGKTSVLHEGYLYARDDGVYILDADTGQLAARTAGRTAPAFSGNMGYFIVDGNLVARQVPAGAGEWQFAGQGELTIAPVVANGRVYVGSATGVLYALDRMTGAVEWQTQLEGPIHAPDEHNVSQPLTGLGLGRDVLLVPHGSKLSAFVTD
jgi:outer membrane protein assembly factor BamB